MSELSTFTDLSAVIKPPRHYFFFFTKTKNSPSLNIHYMKKNKYINI